MKNWIFLLIGGSLVLLCGSAIAMDTARTESGAEAAIARYGLSGSGVTVVILDRGIDYKHPDFIKPDGKTRIKGILDMSAQLNGCAGDVPASIEYTEAEINAALDMTGPAVLERDAVGHGTVTAGIAAGNGRAFASGKYRGIAPGADLLIVKYTSEGAPSLGNQPEELPFLACFDEALEWVDKKIKEIGQPAVALANFGSQLGGPIDGTSAHSRKIDEIFPPDNPGRIWIEGAGDEGNKDTHAGGDFTSDSATELPFEIRSAGTWRIMMWYTGSVPAEVSINLENGTNVGPVTPGEVLNQDGILTIHYSPGQVPDPYTSTSGDRAVFIEVIDYIGNGTIQIRAQGAGTGHFDAYAGYNDGLVFTDMLVDGRLADIAATRSAIVLGAYVNKNSYVDLNGVIRDVSNEGSTGQIWEGSSGDPTRDGRNVLSVLAPGHNVIAAYGSAETTFGQFPGNLVRDGGGYYGRQGAVSGAAPILLGGTALLLELDPELTTNKLRSILEMTARSDTETGSVPNKQWGYGKLDLDAAALAVAANSGSPGMLEFLVENVTVSEDAGTVNFMLRRVGGSKGVASVDVEVTGGTAMEGTDFTFPVETLTWADGDTGDKVISLKILDDSDKEGTETIELGLSGAMGASLGMVKSETVTIGDNDSDLAPTSSGGGGSSNWLVLLGLTFLYLGRNQTKLPRSETSYKQRA